MRNVPDRMRKFATATRGRAAAPMQQATTDVFRLALAVLIVLVVSRIHQNYPFLAKFRPAFVLAIIACTYAWAKPKSLSHENVLSFWWSRSILVIVVLGCLSMVFGISMGNSGQFILFAYSTVLMLAFLVILGSRSTADLTTFVVAYLVGVGMLVYQAMFAFKLEAGPGLARLGALYTFDANDVGLILVTGLPVTVALAGVWKGWRRTSLFLLLAGIGIGIARTGSRGAFLALILSALMLLVLARGIPMSRKLGFAGAVVIALAVAAPPGYVDQMGTLLNPKDDYNWNSPTGRRQVTQRGIGYMMSYPVFGIGINNFMKAECTISPRVRDAAVDAGIRCTPPHNTWVQVGAELGIPGLIAWAVFLVLPVVKLIALSRRLPIAWRRGDLEQRFLFACAMSLPIAIVGFMVGSTFLSFAWIDVPYLLVIMAGTTWWFAKRRLDADRGAPDGARATASRPMRRMRSSFRV